MNDEDIIRRRLMIDGDGTGDARMITKYVKSFIKWCFVDDSPQENQVQFDRLMTQLALIEDVYNKWSNVISMNEIEVQHYDKLKAETYSGSDEAEKQIDLKKEDLNEAKQIRQNRVEYDKLAKLIKEHPPRTETSIKLKQLNTELDALKNSKRELEDTIDLRRKQMHVLVKSLHELQSTVKEPPVSSGAPPTIDLID